LDLGSRGAKEHAAGGSPGGLGGEPGQCEQDQRQDEQHEVEAPPHRQTAAAGRPGPPAYVAWKPSSRPTGAPSARHARCSHDGGNGSRTVSKCVFAMTASRSGFGMPFRFVLPSAASANIVSSSDSNCSAGRTSQTNSTGSSPAFQKRCAVPGSTVSTWPGPIVCFSRPAFRPSVPDLTAKRSLCDGCTWAAATQPCGWTTVSITTASPLVSLEVARKVMRSPVTGLWMVSPVRIILWPPSDAVVDTTDPRSGGLARRRPQAGFRLVATGDLAAAAGRPLG